MRLAVNIRVVASPTLRLVAQGGGGRIEIKDKDGVDAIAVGTTPDDRNGVVEFFDAKGEPMGQLAAPPR